MKKFSGFLFFVIIVALGVAGFLIGWTQFEVPAGSYGVLRSKTHGVDPELIGDGSFRWVWYKLIPTNVEISVFSLAPVSKSMQVRGELPSGSIYASFVGLGVNFSYEVTGNLSFNVKPGSLIPLTGKHGITDQAGLDAYTDRLASEITAFTAQRLRSYSEDEEGMLRLFDNEGTELAADVEKAFPDIENLSLAIKDVSFPDYALYKTTRTLYESYIARQREALSGAIDSAALRHIDSQARVDELNKLGELLTRYPILLHYLALEHGVDLRSLEDIKTQQ